jgi:hypothetical protein
MSARVEGLRSYRISEVGERFRFRYSLASRQSSRNYVTRDGDRERTRLLMQSFFFQLMRPYHSDHSAVVFQCTKGDRVMSF